MFGDAPDADVSNRDGSAVAKESVCPTGAAVSVFVGVGSATVPLTIFFGWRVLAVKRELKRMRARLQERAVPGAESDRHSTWRCNGLRGSPA